MKAFGEFLKTVYNVNGTKIERRPYATV